MRFRRKRETWGVTFTGSSGERMTVWLGGRGRASQIVARLQAVYKDARLVRLRESPDRTSGWPS
jgi:hypothetical protein